MLARFDSQDSYLSGVGSAVPAFVEMDDLVKRFAETVVENHGKWSRGQPIGQPLQPTSNAHGAGKVRR